MALGDELRRLGDELRVLAEEGLQWSEDLPFHRDRYERVRRLGAEAFALADRRGADEIERTVFAELGHVGPIACGDAAVIDDEGRILLIRRADDGLWAMPGGGFHIDETPAEGAAREALEEAGVEVHVDDLVGVYDSRLCGATSSLQLVMFTFLCRLVRDVGATTPHEVLDRGWFAEDELPPLSPGHTVRVPDVFRFLREGRVAFDGGGVPRRHPAVERLVAGGDLIGVHDITVWGGDTHLQMSAYAGAAELPPEIVSSVRGLVVVPTEAGPHLVVCESVDGDVHPWPGGRREAGETHAETLVREVHEETGWLVDPASLVRLGWLRFAISSPRPAVSKGPHPDFLQVVYTAVAAGRDVAHDAEWADVMGQEVASTLVPLHDAHERFDDAVTATFVRMARDAHLGR